MENNKQIDINDFKMFRFGRTEIGTPVVKEYFGRNKWIDYGQNNDYPQELLRLYQNASGLHKSLIERKASMIAGSGFNPIKSLEDMLENPFSKDDLDQIAYKCALDLVIFGGYYLKLIYSKTGQIAQIDHIPLEKVRIEKPTKEDDGQISGFYMSADWLAYKREDNKPLYIKAFDTEAYKEFPEQLYYAKQYSPGMDYYTIPSYSAVVNYIKLGWEISTFSLKNVQNGLMPGMVIINKAGIPPATQREAEYNELKRRYAGAEAAGDFIMVYAENAEKAPEFLPIELNSSDERFRDLSIQIDNEIMRAHKFTSALAGIETSGKLGSKNEIKEQLEMLQLTVIHPLQKIINDSFNEFAKVNNLPQEFSLIEYKMFKDSEINSLINLNDLNQAIIDKVLEQIPIEELMKMVGLEHIKPKQIITPNTEE